MLCNLKIGLNFALFISMQSVISHQWKKQATFGCFPKEIFVQCEAYVEEKYNFIVINQDINCCKTSPRVTYQFKANNKDTNTRKQELNLT